MKMKKLKIPFIILAVGILLTVAAYLLTAITKKPVITQHDFHYSATYRLDGEEKTLEGIYRGEFVSVGEGIDPIDRYYRGSYLSHPEEGSSHAIATKGDLTLSVVFIFSVDYLMGDGDAEDALDAPYLAVYDQEGAEYDSIEILGQFEAELLSWELPQPIENSFVFAGFSGVHSGTMFAMLIVGYLVVIACLIFVKKDEETVYKKLDKVSIVFNWIVCLAVIPFITLVAGLMGVYVSGEEFVYQAALCMPTFTAFTVAASISLRRKEFKKTEFFIQFVGPVLFYLLGILESVLSA